MITAAKHSLTCQFSMHLYDPVIPEVFNLKRFRRACPSTPTKKSPVIFFCPQFFFVIFSRHFLKRSIYKVGLLHS